MTLSVISRLCFVMWLTQDAECAVIATVSVPRRYLLVLIAHKCHLMSLRDCKGITWFGE